MADKPVYQAVVDITFEALKPPATVKSGERLPAKVSQSDIEWLLPQGLIREVTIDTAESEGEA